MKYTWEEIKQKSVEELRKLNWVDIENCKPITILGTGYLVFFDTDPAQDKNLKNLFGYCDYENKVIVIADFNKIETWKDEDNETKIGMLKITVRHEIIHAFLRESGLAGSSNPVDAWAENEEMIDWFAIQLPKIVEAINSAYGS